MQKIQIKDFNLQHTLESAQLFRILKKNNGYYITARDKLFFVQQQEDQLLYDGVDEQFMIDYFALDEDHAQLVLAISVDEKIKTAIKQYYGMRILRQDPWETTVNFICSAAANVPKITMNVNLLAERFGKKITLHDVTSYTFPEPGTMQDLAIIKDCKTGFRAEYLFAANTMLTDQKLAHLRNLCYSDAKRELIKNAGIGSKVADCILLFGYGFKEAFPVDTWIAKVMKELYFTKKRKVNNQQILAFGQKYFKAHPGYTQMYLFHWIRMRDKNNGKN